MSSAEEPHYLPVDAVIAALQEWNVEDDSIADFEMIQDAFEAVQSVETYQKVAEILQRRMGQFVIMVNFGELKDGDDEHEEKSAVEEYLQTRDETL